MATSGTVTFQTNRDEIVGGALRLVKAVDPENVAGPTATQISNASQALNLMVKAWEGVGIQMWLRKYFALFPQNGQKVYALGSPGPAGDPACFSTPIGTGFVSTTVTSQAGPTLVVGTTSTTATEGIPAITMANAWHIGMEQTNGTMFWTTINGAPAGTTVTLTAAPTVGALTGGAVIAFQTKLTRPLQILDGFVRQNGTNDVPLRVISKEEYNRYGQKGSAGVTSQLVYDPQRTVGYLSLIPTMQDVSSIIFVEAQFAMQDFTAAIDDADLPQEWLDALKFNLALRIAIEYAVSTEDFKMIKAMADSTFLLADSFDQEKASIQFMPNTWSAGFGMHG